jgi:hypothetical protein
VNRIEAFRSTLERLDTITGQLQTLAITLARADELPGLTARTFYPYDRQLLSEEQAAIGHPLRLRKIHKYAPSVAMADDGRGGGIAPCATGLCRSAAGAVC